MRASSLESLLSSSLSFNATEMRMTRFLISIQECNTIQYLKHTDGHSQNSNFATFFRGTVILQLYYYSIDNDVSHASSMLVQVPVS